MRFGGDFHPPVALAATSGYSPTSAARRTKSATTLLVGPREPRSELQNAWASLYPCDQVPPSDFDRMWSSFGKFSGVRLEASRNGCGTVRPQRWQLPRALSYALSSRRCLRVVQAALVATRRQASTDDVTAGVGLSSIVAPQGLLPRAVFYARRLFVRSRPLSPDSFEAGDAQMPPSGRRNTTFTYGLDTA